jgi:hypothetical protein
MQPPQVRPGCALDGSFLTALGAGRTRLGRGPGGGLTWERGQDHGLQGLVERMQPWRPTRQRGQPGAVGHQLGIEPVTIAVALEEPVSATGIA